MTSTFAPVCRHHARARRERRAGRLGRRAAAAPEPHHSARPVSAQHLPRQRARLRLRRRRRSRSRSRACSRPPMRRCTVVERIFFYMPLQHAERREVQDESVAAYPAPACRGAARSCTRLFDGALRSAENHRAIIERFGRFPHRNRAAAAHQHGRGSSTGCAPAARPSLSKPPTSRLELAEAPLERALRLEQLHGQRRAAHVHTEIAHQPPDHAQPRQRRRAAPASRPGVSRARAHDPEVADSSQHRIEIDVGTAGRSRWPRSSRPR